MNPKETATECFCLIVDSGLNDASPDPNVNKITTLGDYLIEWRRKNFYGSKLNESKQSSDSDLDAEETDSESEISSKKADDFFNVKTKIILPEITAEKFPFFIESIMPTCGSMNEPLTIIYKIHNKTQTYLDIECNLEQNEYFALSGKKMVSYLTR